MTGRITRLIGVLTIVGLTGCGIPADDEARTIEPPPGPYQALASQAPHVPDPGSSPQTVFLVKDGMLVPVIRRSSGPPSITMTLDELMAGPTAADRARGLDSALTGAPIVGSVHIDNGRAVAELTDALQEAGRNDQILALGQIVCTLDARADVAGVVFVRDGAPTGVPRADGSLSAGPLTTADYATLMTDA